MGVVKCWDIEKGAAVMDFHPGCAGQVTGLEIWTNWNVMVLSTTSGLCNIDIRTGSNVKMNYTQDPVLKICSLDHHVFAGVGRDLMQYDARVFDSGKLDSKLKVVASWSLGSPVTAVTA